MKLSFKFKIALISFAVSGTLLAGFGMALFAFVYSVAAERMDGEILALAEAPFRGPPDQELDAKFGRTLQAILGEKRAGQTAMMVLGTNDCIVFQTTNAPAGLLEAPRPDRPENDGRDDRAPSRPGGGERPPPDRSGDFQPMEKGRPDHEFRPGGRSTSLFHTMSIEKDRWRIGAVRTWDKTVLVGVNMNLFNAEINRLRNLFLVSVPIGLFLLGGAGWFLAGRAMKPVALIADTAAGITARGLDKRVLPVATDRELERLVRVVNGMLDRLEKSYHQAVRFSADAAHELQTPLTVLQGELDNAIQESDDGSVEQQRYSMLLEELSQLKAVVQKLLLLAHADEGRLRLNRMPVDLVALIRDAAEDIEMMAPFLTVELEVPEQVMVSADAALLVHVIRNMTTNAAKYTEADGRVVFRVTCASGQVIFTLSNSGAPIPEEDRPLLFERFHRVDKSHASSGSGLGLSLAREIARAHGGDVALGECVAGMVSFVFSIPQMSA